MFEAAWRMEIKTHRSWNVMQPCLAEPSVILTNVQIPVIVPHTCPFITYGGLQLTQHEFKHISIQNIMTAAVQCLAFLMWFENRTP